MNQARRSSGEGVIAVEADGFNRYGRAAWSCPSEVAHRHLRLASGQDSGTLHLQEHMLGNGAHQYAQTASPFATHDQQLCFCCSSYQRFSGATAGIQDFLHHDGRELVLDPPDSRVKDVPALGRVNPGTRYVDNGQFIIQTLGLPGPLIQGIH